MKRVSSIQVVCTTVVSAALHMSLLMLATNDASPVTSVPIEDVFHVELTSVDNEPDPNEKFFEPNPTKTLRDQSPERLHQAQILAEPPSPPNTFPAREPLQQPILEKILKEVTTSDPKIASALESLTQTKVADLNPEVAIKKLDPSNEPRPTPIHPVPPTHDTPLQLSEINPGSPQEIIKPKARALEPTSTLPVQSEPLLPMPQETLNRQPVSQREKITHPVRPIGNPDLVKQIQPTKPVQPSHPSKVTEAANKVYPTLVEETELALKPLKSDPQIIDRSRQDVARSAPVPEHASHGGLQEKEAIAQYVTLLHKAISSRARRDYPSRAIKRREEGRVLAEIKVDSDGELLEIKISNESTASDTLIRAAERAIKKEAPFAQFAQVVTKGARWFSLSLNYRIHSSSN